MIPPHLGLNSLPQEPRAAHEVFDSRTLGADYVARGIKRKIILKSFINIGLPIYSWFSKKISHPL